MDYYQNLKKHLSPYLSQDLIEYEILPHLSYEDILTNCGEKCFNNDIYFHFKDGEEYHDCQTYCLNYLNYWINKQIETPSKTITFIDVNNHELELHLDSILRFEMFYQKPGRYSEKVDVLTGNRNDQSQIESFDSFKIILTFDSNSETLRYLNINEYKWVKIETYFKLNRISTKKNNVEIEINIIKPSWYLISLKKGLPESFIRKYKNSLTWNLICEYQVLSENFIREFQDRVDWKTISLYQTLSETFIREFSDKIHWYRLGRLSRLSETFIREFQNRLDLGYVFMYQNLRTEFMNEFH